MKTRLVGIALGLFLAAAVTEANSPGQVAVALAQYWPF